MMNRKNCCLGILWMICAGTVLGQVRIPETYVQPVSAANTFEPGFVWNVFQNQMNQDNSLARADRALSGGLVGNDGAPLANLANPAALGPASGAGGVQLGSEAWRPISFNIPGVINFSQVGGESNGSLRPDLQMPGIPGTTGSTDGIAGEVLTWLDLPQGVHTLIVNSDDGFRLTLGGASPADGSATVVGEFNGGRGASDTMMTFEITRAGLYAARILWEEGGGGANLEFVEVLPGGNRVAVNDPASTIRAYRRVNVPTPSYVRSFTPAPGAVVRPEASIEVELVDVSGLSGNPSLFVDGQEVVSPSVTRSNSVVTVKHTPAVPFAPGTMHEVRVEFTDTELRSKTWSFGPISRATRKTIDTVRGAKGYLLGGAMFTPAGGGHTGQPGDLGIEFGDGSSESVIQVADATFLNATTGDDEMTYSVWQKLSDLSNSSIFWTDSPSTAGGLRGFQAHAPWGNGDMAFDSGGCCEPGLHRIAAGIASFADYTGPNWWRSWHHLVFTKKGGQKRIFIDGKIFLEGTNSAPLARDFTALWIGAQGGETRGRFNNIRGRLDDFAIFDKALTLAQVQELFGGTAPSSVSGDPGLLTYFPFNDAPSVPAPKAMPTLTWQSPALDQPLLQGGGYQVQALASPSADVRFSVVSGRANISGSTLYPEAFGPLVVAAEVAEDSSVQAVRSMRLFNAGALAMNSVGSLTGFARGDVAGIHRVGNRAYLALRTGGLGIVDLTNPDQPAWVGGYDTPGEALDVDVSGTLACVADSWTGIMVLDVSNPASPQLLSSLGLSDSARSVQIVGNLAYVAGGWTGLQIVDLANPTNPKLVGVFDSAQYANDVLVVGQRAYVAENEAGLILLDVSNPSLPVRLGSFDTPGTAMGVQVVGNLAYVADGWSGLRILNVSNPANPTSVGTLGGAGFAEEIQIEGTRAYVARGDDGIQVVDISNPANPVETARFDTPGYARGLRVSGNRAYVADRGPGLQVIRLDVPPSSSQVGNLDTAGWADGIDVEGTRAYLADGGRGLRIVDISDPAHPRQLGRWQAWSWISSVDVVGNLAYVADGGAGLQILDVSDPANPIRLGGLDTGNFARTVRVSGGYAWVCDEFGGLKVIDVTSSARPELVAGYDTPGLALGLDVFGGRAYVADREGGLLILDVSVPSNPVRLGSVGVSGDALDVLVVGSYAYVARGNRVQVVDVRDPVNPVVVGGVDIRGWARGLTLVGHEVVVSAEDGGLTLLDARDPVSPVVLGRYDTPGNAKATAVVGRLAYAADGAWGLQVVRLHEERLGQTISHTAPSVVFPRPLGYSLNPVASSGLPVTVSVLSGPAVAQGVLLLVQGVGTIVVRLEQAGNPTYQPAVVDLAIASPQGGYLVTWVSPQVSDVLLPSSVYPLVATNAGNEAVSFEVISGPGSIFDGTKLVPSGPGPITVAAQSAGSTLTGPTRSLRTFNAGTPSPSRLGAYPGVSRGDVVKIRRDGDRAYVAMGEGGLAIFDITDLDHPLRLGGYDTPSWARDLAVVGTLAYVATDGAGLLIFDVADPAHPSLLGSYDTFESAMGVQVVGSVAYVADGWDGLQIIDVSNPTQPRFLGSIDTPGFANAVQVVGNRAYVADGGSGLFIFNVTDPTAPTLLGSFDTPGEAMSVQVVGNVAYVADHWGGLRMVDVTNPALPTHRGAVENTGYVEDVEVSGTLAYLATAWEGVRVVNIANPLSPSQLTRHETAGHAKSLRLIGNRIYVADYFGGLVVLNAADSSNLHQSANLDIAGWAEYVQVVGNRAYVADGRVGLRILDITDPANPVMLGLWPAANEVLGVQVVGTTAYVADGWEGLQVLDVSNPAVPRRVGRFDPEGFVRDVRVYGNRAYLSEDNNGIQIVDISVPTNPVLLGEYDTPGFVEGLRLVGNRLFIADGEAGLVILDVGYPSRPVRIGTFDSVGYATDVEVVGAVAFLADGWNGLRLVDVQDARFPVALGGVSIPGWVRGVTVSGHEVFLAVEDQGMSVVDASRWDSLTVTARFDTPGHARSVQLVGNVAHVADGEGGVQILKIRENRLGQSLVFNPKALVGTSDLPLPLSASAGSGLPVTFSVVSGPGQVAQDQLSFSRRGTVVVRASQAGDSFYLPAAVDRVVVFPKLGQALTWTAPASDAPLPQGQGRLLAATASSGLPVTFRLVSGPARLSGGTLTPTGAGPIVVAAEQAGNDTYEPGVSFRTFNDGALSLVHVGAWGDAFSRGEVLDIKIVGQRAYLAMGAGGLGIVDTTDPDHPVWLGGLDTADWAMDVDVVGTVAYVADGYAGLSVIDVSDPARPVLLSQFDTGEHANGVRVVGSRVYLADGWNGVEIIGVSNPTRPVWLGGYETTGYAQDLEVVGNRLYVADDFAGLLILDLTQPDVPVRLGSYDTPGNARDVQISGNLAYVADNWSGLQILNVANPAAPVLVGTRGGFGMVESLQLDGGTLYVAGSEDGVWVVDVRNASDPQRLSRYDTPGYASAVRRVGPRLYVADGRGGLLVLNIDNPSSPSRVSDLELAGFAVGVQREGNTLYLADYSAGLRILDITDPANPMALGRWAAGRWVEGLHVVGTLAYVADGHDGLQILDVSNPSDPWRLGSYDTPGYARGVRVVGNLALVADSGAGVQVLDVSDPRNPILLGTYDTPGEASSIAVVGNRAYVADGNAGLLILDISVPSAPVRIGGFDTPDYAADVKMVGSLAYVADGGSGLQILDVRDPVAPVRLGGVGINGWARGVTVAGQEVYLAGEGGGVSVVDARNAASPVVLGRFDTPGSAKAIELQGGLAYVADGEFGLQVIRIRETRLGQTLTFEVPSRPVPGISQFPLTASASSGLPVTFRVLSGPGAIANNNQLTVTGFGVSVVVRAEQVGNATYHPVSVDRVFVVPRAAQSVTWAQPGIQTPLVIGRSYTLQATASSGFPVTYSLVSGAATVTGNTLQPTGPGPLVVMAEQAGDSTREPGRALRTFNVGASLLTTEGRFPGSIQGSARGVLLRGDRVYVAAEEGGLRVYDVTGRSNPMLLGVFDTSGTCRAVDVVGDFAFVADGGEGLAILNVSNPAAIVEVGRLDTPDFAQSVQVVSSKAYLADGNSGVRIIDVSNPAAPRNLGAFDTAGYARDVRIHESYAYVADQDNGLLVLHIAQPATPTLVRRIDTGGQALGLRIADGRIQLAHGWNGLTIYGLADPSDPVKLGGAGMGWAVEALSIVGSKTYLAVGPAGLHVADVSSPSNPVMVGSFDTPGFGFAVDADAGHAFVADGVEGLRVVDINPPESPTGTGSAPTYGYTMNLQVAGGFLYAAEGGAGLRISYLYSGGDVETASRWPTRDWVEGLHVVGNVAYLAEGSLGLQILDVSDREQPRRLGGFDTPGWARNVRVEGNLAFVADSEAGVQIINVQDPARPFQVGRYLNPAGYANTVRVVGNRLFVASGGVGLDVVDVSVPSLPTLMGVYDSPDWAMDVEVVGNLAYLADGGSGFHVIDLTNPFRPTRRGGVGINGWARGLSVFGHRVHVAAEGGGMTILDLSDTANPVELGRYVPPRTVKAVQSTGVRSYLAEGPWGLEVVSNFETKQSQVITFNPPARMELDGVPQSISATVDTGLPVTLSVVSGFAQFVNGKLELRGTGVVVLRASVEGDAQFKPASVDRQVLVTLQTQTLTWNSPVRGSVLQKNGVYPLNVTANSGLPVSFRVVSGAATLAGNNLTIQGAGTVLVEARQDGDPSHYPVVAQGTFEVLDLESPLRLNADARVTPDTSKPGFVWRVFHNNTNIINSTKRTEDALAGRLTGANGRFLLNLANTNATGVALAPAAPLVSSNAPARFDIATVINVSSTGGGAVGAFGSDGQMPGIPGTTGSRDGVAVEILTYLDLPAGVVTMGINSDDGFQTRSGPVADALFSKVLGTFEGGRASAETLFTFRVPEAGVYAFSTLYEQGNGGAGIEWYTVKSDGTRVLVNDVANGGIRAYRALLNPAQPPYVKSISPLPGDAMQNQQPSSVVVVLADGTTEAVEEASIDFRIDGTRVTDFRRQGSEVILSWGPGALSVPSESHVATLSFRGRNGYTRTAQWSFRNLKNVVLPSRPLLSEYFDSTPVGTLPAGWVAMNHSVTCSTGNSLTDVNSTRYENWIPVDAATFNTVEPRSANQVAPGERRNGEPVDLSLFRSGSFLLALSDGRCNGTDVPRPATQSAHFGQSLWIESPSFDLTGVRNPVLSFSSGYVQNEDSIAACEYSVDGGPYTPVAIYLDSDDIARRPDGSVDGALTLGRFHTDTALWSEGDSVFGNSFGDFLGTRPARVSEAELAIQPRINDDLVEGHRIEVFRLPLAANSSNVRLRFSYAGSASWYWYIDNIQFFDLGAPTALLLGGGTTGTVREQLPSGTRVGLLSAQDPDPSAVLTYSLVGGDGGEDNASFAVVGNELRTAAAFFYETKREYRVRVRVTNGLGLWLDRPFVVQVQPLPIRIVGRHAFYNQSAWDGNNAGANATDDAAIATDKKPLFQGVKASLTNYTSYSRGLNGIMVDITGLPVGTPTAADFGFKVGRTSTPSTWAAGPAPSSVTVRRGAGVGGSDRVTLIWTANDAVKKNWLQVRVKATAATGLLAEDVFYFGNAVGETGNSTADAVVNATDEVRIRANPRSLLNPAPVTFLFDINRDKSVNATDQVLARANVTSPLTALPLITPGAPGSAAALAGAGGWVGDSEVQGLTLDWMALGEGMASGNLPRVEEVDPDRGSGERTGTLRLSVLAPGLIQLEARGSEAGRMRLQFSDQAPTGPWRVVSEAVRKVEGADRVSWTLSVEVSSGARFYRWVLLDGDTGPGLGSR